MGFKNLKVTDATKDELITYFFQPKGFGGGYRIPALKDEFLLWLYKKRSGELYEGVNSAIEESQSAMHQYLDYVKQANAEKDIEKKLALFDKANKAYERYEKAEARYKKLDKKYEELTEV